MEGENRWGTPVGDSHHSQCKQEMMVTWTRAVLKEAEKINRDDLELESIVLTNLLNIEKKVKNDKGA